VFNAFTGVIKGRVQGVGFRYFVKNIAEELDLTGWVRNLADGTVEILAIGQVPALEQFMQKLKEGSIDSRVESTNFHWLQEPAELTRFEIRG
jgi:acylphosphatase